MPMSSEMDSIVHLFFQKNNLEEAGLHQIEQFVNDFPYCAPAQLLLAKKYQQSGDPLFGEQACKTALFFTNPHWLNDLLYPVETQAITEDPVKKADITDSEENTVPGGALTVEQHTGETGLSAEQEVAHAVVEEDTSFKPEIPSAKLRSILDNPVDPGQHSDSLIPIEPLHTVDYFASQGIKISADIEGQDRLSIKLRSFTDWLKTMKKIHPEKLESGMDQGAQSAIQHIAEHSNEAKEVVTEAMAEVFAKQGLHHKAAEVYRKLSLLNPGKRVYFAAKISKLNNS